MEDFFKYPRTYHLPWSLGSTNDDKFMEDTVSFIGKRIVITEKMDGENCLGPHTIIKTECGDKTIKEICDNKFRGKSLSMNISTGEVEYQNIVSHNISDPNIDDEWFEIELENGVTLQITSDDYVFFPMLNCYRKVSELKVNDNIIFLP